MIKNKQLAIFAGLIFILFSACNKDGEVGLDVQPATDKIEGSFIDTTSVVAFIQKDDSVRTDEAALSTGLLTAPLVTIGSYNDPVLGIARAGFCTQFNLANNAPNLDFTGGIGGQNNLALDSAILTLEYRTSPSDLRKYYGSLEPQTFKVFKLTDTLALSSTYYSNRKKNFDTLNPIGSLTFTPQPDSLVKLGATKASPHIRIPLDYTFAKSILDKSGTADLSNNTELHKFINGFYIAPVNTSQSQGQGALLYFNPFGVYSKLTMYYRRQVNAPQVGDTLKYSFEINSATAFYNRYMHDRSGVPLQALMDGQPDSVNIYTQSNGGVRTKLMLPYIQNWNSNGPVVINKAELLLKVDASTVTTAYGPHSRLFLLAIDTLGVGQLPADFYELVPGYGGAYNTVTQTYSFNIARQIQGILSGKYKNKGFYLIGGGNAVNAQRTVLGAPSKINSKLRLRITYTKL